jgi:hypothetical protein
MAPEGYVPLALLGAWCRQAAPAATCEALAQAYARYQECSLEAAAASSSADKSASVSKSISVENDK